MTPALALIQSIVNVGHAAHRAISFGVKAKLLKHPWKVFYNPKGSSWFNAAETLISVMKNRLSKAFALTLRDISTKEEFRELIEQELSKMVNDYIGNEMIHAVVPELQQEIERYGKLFG